MRITSILLLLAFLLSGCAVNTNVNRYALMSPGAKPCCAHSCVTLYVREPIPQAGFDTDAIIYIKCPYQLQAYSRNRWVAPPHEMLTGLIAQHLRNSCFFKAVVTAPFAATTNYQLETRLIKLQHEFLCCPSRVRMVMQATLIDSCCHEIIGERVFEVIVIAPQDNPCGAVVAANTATQIILGRLSRFVIGCINCHPIIPIPRRIALS